LQKLFTHSVSHDDMQGSADGYFNLLLEGVHILIYVLHLISRFYYPHLIKFAAGSNLG